MKPVVSKSSSTSVRGLALFAFLATLIGSGIISYKARSSEVLQTRRTTDEAAISLANSLSDRLTNIANSVKRIAKRVSASAPNEQEFGFEANLHLADFQEFKTLQWIDSTLHVRWITPRKGNEMVVGLDVTFEGRRRAAVQRILNGDALSMSRQVDLIQGGKGFLIYAPVRSKGKLLGMIAAVCLVEKVIDAMPNTGMSNYRFEIADGSESMFANGKLAEGFVSSHTISPFGVPWTIRISPSEALLARERSPLPWIILLSGAAIGSLLAYAILLVGRSRSAEGEERSTREFLESIADTAQTIIYVLDPQTGTPTYMNRHGVDLFGFTAEQLKQGGRELRLSLSHPDEGHLADYRFKERQTLADGEFISFENRALARDGTWRWILSRETVLSRDKAGRATAILGCAHDISDRYRAEEELKRTSAMLEQFFQHAPIGESMVALDGKWLSVNPALCRLLGYTEEELLNRNFQSVTHPDDLPQDMEMVDRMLKGEIETYTLEKRYVHRDGHSIWIQLDVCLLKDANDKPQCFISQIQDISARKSKEALVAEYSSLLEYQKDELIRANARLEASSTTDALTGLANRRTLNERIETLFRLREKYGSKLAVVMLDIDHFKSVNDRFGHLVGDDVLIAIANVVKTCAREGDLAVRYGGEEFAILCPSTDAVQAEHLADRIRAAIEQLELECGPVSASFGVAEQTASMHNPEELLSAADRALYASKESGRNRVTRAA